MKRLLEDKNAAIERLKRKLEEARAAGRGAALADRTEASRLTDRQARARNLNHEKYKSVIPTNTFLSAKSEIRVAVRDIMNSRLHYVTVVQSLRYFVTLSDSTTPPCVRLAAVPSYTRNMGRSLLPSLPPSLVVF